LKILCVVDHFGSGGAQRQMAVLACGLKEAGHEVECFIYYPQHTFFRPMIDQAGIEVHEVSKGRGFSLVVLWRLIRLMRVKRYSAVIAFLGSPAVYAEISKAFSRNTILVVSERSSHLGDDGPLAALLRRLLHNMADYVVTNSHSHAAWLRHYRWLRHKVRTIYNGYTMNPLGDSEPADIKHGVRLLVVGRVGPEKNGLRLVQALIEFRRKHGFVPTVAWAGLRDTRSTGVAYCRALEQLLDEHPEVGNFWEWLGERSDVPELLRRHHALIHPSLHEGLPNAVCEAFVSGRPVVASRVCDHPLLVEEGKTGFLCDPEDPESIRCAIERLTDLSTEQWRQICGNARRFAEETLGVDRMVSAYEELLGCAPSRTGA
jgi:glycosyltransferase involved in cell wall biosynthesis